MKRGGMNGGRVGKNGADAWKGEGGMDGRREG
jgi:hypothetical protein